MLVACTFSSFKNIFTLFTPLYFLNILLKNENESYPYEHLIHKQEYNTVEFHFLHHF